MSSRKPHRRKKGVKLQKVQQTLGSPAEGARPALEIERSIFWRQFSGPLPPPEQLAQYERVLPGLAERIVRRDELMTETGLKQSTHRQEMEKAALKSKIFGEALGQWFSFIITIVAIITGGILIYLDKQVGGLGTVISALAALIGIFLTGKLIQRKELSSKNEALAQAIKRM